MLQPRVRDPRVRLIVYISSVNVSSTTIAHGNEHPWAGVPEGFRVRFFADTRAFSQEKFSFHL